MFFFLCQSLKSYLFCIFWYSGFTFPFPLHLNSGRQHLPASFEWAGVHSGQDFSVITYQLYQHVLEECGFCECSSGVSGVQSCIPVWWFSQTTPIKRLLLEPISLHPFLRLSSFQCCTDCWCLWMFLTVSEAAAILFVNVASMETHTKAANVVKCYWRV